MSRKSRKAKLRGKHSATNEMAPTVPRVAPFTTRTSTPTPLYDEVVQKLNVDPAKDMNGFKKIPKYSMRYPGTTVPLYGINVPNPGEKPDEEL